MKHKNVEIVPMVLMSLFGLIIAGIIIYAVKNSLHSSTDIADEIIKHENEVAADYADYDITMYDGEEVRGDQVISFIKKQLGDYSSSETAPIYVQVLTKVSGTTNTNTYTNKMRIADIKNFDKAQYYIKPTAYFTGEVIKTANKAILGIKFVQK